MWPCPLCHQSLKQENVTLTSELKVTQERVQTAAVASQPNGDVEDTVSLEEHNKQ